MSVIIKGETMPSNCYECPCLRHDSMDGIHMYQCNVTLRMVDEGDAFFIRNYKDCECPLIELPSTHGRLIDGDLLHDSFKESIYECHKWAKEIESGEMYTRVSQALGTFVEASLRTKAMPTIIESEKNDY